MFQGYKALLVEKQNKIVVVKFNNLKKRNSLNLEGYREIARVLREVDHDDGVTLVVFTGVGNFYTAGNDLSQGSRITDIEAYIKETSMVFKDMMISFIECSKVIVSLVNGPCIGIGTTLAGLSDLVWCSEQAYFLTPFVKLGIVPEAGSSYLFPLLMGRSKATEMLLLGEKLTAQEALRFNFVSRVYKPKHLIGDVWPKLRAFSELPPQSLRISKKLMRMQEKQSLLKAFELECDELNKRFQSEEFFNALVEFSMKKSKL